MEAIVIKIDYDNWANDTMEQSYRSGYQLGFIRGRRKRWTEPLSEKLHYWLMRVDQWRGRKIKHD